MCRPIVVLASCRSLDLTGPLLLGGVPDLPEDFPVRSRDFEGCIRDLNIDGWQLDMARFIANNGTNAGTTEQQAIQALHLMSLKETENSAEGQQGTRKLITDMFVLNSTS